MSIMKCCRVIACPMAVVGMILPLQWTHASEPHRRAAGPGNVDVALSPEGLLAGQLLDRRGRGLARETIAILNHNRQEIGRVSSDRDGNFFIQGLRTGTHHLIVKDHVTTCRIWHPTVAPPSAKPSVRIVATNAVTSGQIEPLKCFLAEPLIVAGIIAVAVAVPVAVHNHRLDRDSGS